jgi:putative redox protein
VNVDIHWKGKMAFEGTADSGFVQKMDSGISVGGENSAVRPMELIAFGLAGCTGMDVISILQKKRQPVQNFQVKVHLENAKEHPKVFLSATIEYIVTGREVEEIALLRAIELSAEKYCPVQAMLSNVFPIQMIYKVIDDDNIVVSEGHYRPK